MDTTHLSSTTAAPRTITVPGFELVSELGRGATTVVYRARPTGTGGPDVAVKMLREQTVDAAGVAAVFRREAALLARVAHPSLTAVHAVGEAAGRPYLVLELVDGAALASVIEAGPLPEQHTLHVAIDTAGALEAAHRMRLVHRDIKPHNLLVTPSGRTKLIDFDLATWAGELMSADTVTGTLTYSAPEQTGMLARPVDARTDLYALGVVLFECATSHPPFVSQDVGELLRLHAVEQPPNVRSLNPQYSPGFAAVISKLLAKDPDDRYQTATGLLNDLRHLLDRPDDWPFELDGASDVEDPSLTAGPPLVGRKSELSQLITCWQRTTHESALALLEGDIGTGKSRLASELRGVVAREGGLALHATCTPDDTRPLRVISSAVQRHVLAVQRLGPPQREAAEARLRQAAGAGAPLLTALSPALGVLLKTHAELADTDRQEQLTEAVATFLAELGRLEGRLLLVLDDAQHLDDASQRMLSHLRADNDAPVLVVLATAPNALASLEVRLPVPVDTKIHVGPLEPAAVTELIASELGGAEMAADIASQLATRTDGNPFAVLEFIRHLIEAGGLQPASGRWILDGDLLDRLHLPSDVLDLVLARLDGLGTGVRRLLATAAVQGMRFDASLLATWMPADEISEALTVATRHRVVEHVADGPANLRPSGIYTFVHTKLRDALAPALDDPAVAHAHQRFAEALEARPVTDVERIYALARHWAGAGADVEPQRTYDACVAAAQAALVHHAPAEAAAFLANATDAAAHAGIDLDVPFRHMYATALLRAGDLAHALDQCRHALTIEQDPLRRAELFNVIATIQHSTGDGVLGVETVQRGLAELGSGLPKRTPLLIASTLARLVAGLAIAASRHWYGKAPGQRRQRYLLEATLLDTGAQSAAVATNIALCTVFLSRGVLPANRVGRSAPRVRILAALAVICSNAGAARTALRLCGTAAREAATMRDPALIGLVSCMRGMVELVSGYRTAPLATAMEEQGRWLQLPDYLMMISLLAQELTGAGYTAAASMWIERAHHRLRIDGSPRDSFPIECAASAVEALGGRIAAADATLRAAVAGLSDEAGTAQQQLYVVWAKLVSLIEQGELGAEFDDVVTQFDEAQIPSRHGHALGMRHLAIYGRLAQAHAAKLRQGATRDSSAHVDVALAHARDGIRALRSARGIPRLYAGRLFLRAWMLHLEGHDRASLRMLHRALRAADAADAPLLAFDLAHLHARILRARGQEPEAQRQAMTALMLAIEYGWECRVRWIRDEFAIRDRFGRSIISHGSTRRSMSSSSRQAAVVERRRLEALQQVSATAASVVDPEELIRVALDVTLRLLSAERVFVFLADQHPDTVERSDTLRPHRGCDIDGNDLRELTGYSSTLVEQVWQTGEALVVTGSEQGAALGSESAVVHGLRSILVAPLQVKSHRLGVVYLDSRVARGIFTEDDAELLGVITQQMAAALETARAAQLEAAVHAANRQRQLAETLRTSMTDLNSTLDPDEVLRRLLTTVAATLPGDHSVLLRKESGRAVVVTPEPGAPDSSDGHAVPELDTDARLDYLMAAEMALIGDRGPSTLTLPGRVSALLGEPRSWLAAPVTLHGELSSVIIVGSYDVNSYGDVEVTVAAALAKQGAVAYENAQLFSRVQELATTDELTGAATRRHFWELAEFQRRAAVRHGRPLAAIMLDIDHFKDVNDRYGHAAGDTVLRGVAARLRNVARESDVLGRYGGEEFAMLLPETADASSLAERLRAAVADSEIPTNDAPLRVTISVGVGYLQPDEHLDALLARADAAMYRSKAAGRNRVTIA